MVGTSTEGVIKIADEDQHTFLIKGGGKVI